MVMHGCDETSCVNAVECLLLGDQAANLEQMARRCRSAGRARWGGADRRRAAARVRAIREALCGGYDPGWLAAAVAAGDPRPGQRVLF